MFDENILIDSTNIGLNSRPYVIAEAGSNFNQSIEMAKELLTSRLKVRLMLSSFTKANLLYPELGKPMKFLNALS